MNPSTVSPEWLSRLPMPYTLDARSPFLRMHIQLDNGSRLLVIESAFYYTLDVWLSDPDLGQMISLMRFCIQAIQDKPVYIIAPDSIVHSIHLSHNLNILAQRNKYILSSPDCPIFSDESSITYESASNHVQVLAQLLHESDPTCPGIHAATSLIHEIVDGVYGDFATSSQLILLHDQPVGACLLSHDFDQLLLSHIFVLPQHKQKGLASRALSQTLAIQHSISGPSSVKASVDIANTGSNRLMYALRFSPYSEIYSVCEILS